MVRRSVFVLGTGGCWGKEESMQPHDDGSGHVHSHQGRTEDHSFDALTKGLANGSISRGRAIKLMGTALLGGVLVSIPGMALADHTPGHGGGGGGGGAPGGSQGCPSGQVRVKGRCQPLGACDQDRDCLSPEDSCCNGVCTTLGQDQNNCGACGNVCPEGDICQGTCMPPLHSKSLRVSES